MLDSIRQFVKRGRRGYSTADTYSFDVYLAGVIAGGLRELRERSIGHPTDITFEHWQAILRRMEEGFRAYAENDEMTAATQEALKLFAQRFGHLWD